MDSHQQQDGEEGKGPCPACIAGFTALAAAALIGGLVVADLMSGGKLARAFLRAGGRPSPPPATAEGDGDGS